MCTAHVRLGRKADIFGTKADIELAPITVFIGGYAKMADRLSLVARLDLSILDNFRPLRSFRRDGGRKLRG
jgi:hypothetical protein